MRWTLIAIALFGCGGSQKKEPECMDCGLGPGGMNPSGYHEEMQRKALCDRARTLTAAGCSPFDQMDPKLLDNCAVVTSFQMAGMAQCLTENTCDGLSGCFQRMRAATNPPDYDGRTTQCELPKDHDDLAYPVGVPRSEFYTTSYGIDARTFADAPSTKDKPIEVCGFPAAGLWLAHVTCKDGSHPFENRTDAEGARMGNVGEGGRCGRIIDRYQVECPEMTYDVFIDAYRCPR